MATPRFLPDMGGVETHVAEVSRRLAAAGTEVTVACADITDGRAPRETIDGVEVVRLRSHPRERDWCFVPQMGRLVAGGGWDVVHVQSYHTLLAPLAMAAALRAGIPYVVSFHAGGTSARLRGAVRPLQQRALGPLLRRAARLVTLADFESGLYGRRIGIDPGRFVAVPNGADLPPPPPGPDRTEPGLIASVGRLERYKGHHRVIAALPAVLERRPDARLWIAGSGPYEAELRRAAERAGVADRVEIRPVPPGDRAAMAAALSRAAVVVLMSDFETQPIAALEAIALRRRVVVADGSGLAELVARGWARGVPPDAPAAALGGVIAAEMARPALEAAPALPTWDDCARRLLDVYREVVASRAPAAQPAPGAA
jgi:glycosyltransferase involved in cell wall biosynthesis